LGLPAALESLDRAVDEALSEARVARAPVAAACVALAGADRETVRNPLREWARKRRLAESLEFVHDALPILAAGTSAGWGIALIAGTGSFAFGRNAAGRSARCGGWGYLFGDEGSGYAIGLAGLRAVSHAADGRGPPTTLLAALLQRLKVAQPLDLIPAVYRSATDRSAIASLAEVVLDAAAAGDVAAQKIVGDAVGELAEMVAALAETLELSLAPFPLALGGGVLLHSQLLRARVRESLAARGLTADPVACVPEPVLGAVRLARDLANRASAGSSS
jgi:N-acetylglucosamine kinase-like BadF-type ATPase